jgi:hypothetical protein
LFFFLKIFQIYPCLPAISVVQDTMIDSNIAVTAGEFHIFLWEIPLVGETENEDVLGISLTCFSNILMASLFAYTT